MKFPEWPRQIGSRDIKFGLERVEQLLLRLGNPHCKLPPVIHIAGTNGKGSISSYLKNILLANNYKVHCYNSPHILEFNERIFLANNFISDKFLKEISKKCQDVAELEPKIPVTFFEGVTVMAFLAFSLIKADFLILETGMGGRLDATNVVKNPLATIISSISLDHTDFLGNSLEKIAYEKAGIIKKKSPIFFDKQDPKVFEVIEEVAKKNNSELYTLGQNFFIEEISNGLRFSMEEIVLDLPKPNMLGSFQYINLAIAVATLIKSKIILDQKKIVQGVVQAKWPARIEKITYGKFLSNLNLNYHIYLDVAHNVAAAKELCLWMKEEKRKRARIHVVCSMMQDKDIKGCLRYFSKHAYSLTIISIANNNRVIGLDEMGKICDCLQINHKAFDNFNEAIGNIATNFSHKNIILICGSLFVAEKFLKENIEDIG
jgi:dihydrofolate synthase/folylpolyglutamate synthase